MSAEMSLERPTTLPLNTDTRVERRVHFRDVVDHSRTPKHNSTILANTISPRKFKHESDFRPKRKRSNSFSMGDKYGNKRRRKGFVLPSKFLLGGTFSDPLNLGSLQDDEQEKPKLEAESITTKRANPVRVIIPNNIKDPLNLEAASPVHQDLEMALLSNRRRRRNRKRKRRLSAPGGVNTEDALNVSESSLPELTKSTPLGQSTEQLSANFLDRMKPLAVNTNLPVNAGYDALADTPKDNVMGDSITPAGTNNASISGQQKLSGLFKRQRSKLENKIVSPVIPQPGGDRKRHPSKHSQLSDQPHLSQQMLQPPKKYNPKNELFQYGNYNKYYGYRNPDHTPDARLNYLSASWFEGKEILDVGCNIGHITLTVARDYNPKRIVGIDIDKKLINIAQKNIKHYIRQGGAEERNFPKSMRVLYGPLKPPAMTDASRSFPYNIKFVHANYVLESDELLETVRPEFDIILCLSISKWVHLNFGDDGLKRFFCRAYANLKPGGKFILEPQAWSSYSKRRKLTPRIFENYKKIRLFPEKFKDFLLDDVGFTTSQKLPTPQHTARGFQRPIIVYTKGSDGNRRGSLSDTKITSSQSVISSKSSEINEQSTSKYSNQTLLKVDNASYKVHEMPDNSELEVSVSCEDSESVSKSDDNCAKIHLNQEHHNDLTKSSNSNKKLHLEGCSILNSKKLSENLESCNQSALVSEKDSCDNTKTRPFGDVSSSSSSSNSRSCRSSCSSTSSSSSSCSCSSSCNCIPLRDNISDSKKCSADAISSSEVNSRKGFEKDSDLPESSVENRTSVSDESPSENGKDCNLNSSSRVRQSDHDNDDSSQSSSKRKHQSNDS